MPDETPKKLLDIHAAHGVFPLTQMVEAGLWSALSANAKAVLGPLWNFHRQYPDACRPSRQTLAAAAGVSPPSVTKALKELETIGIVTVILEPGPRTNTYRLQWANLKVPNKNTSKDAPSRSPFVMPTNTMTPEVEYNEDGTGKLLWSKTPVKGYKMADGCFVRSAKEQHAHDYLVAWNVPHWTDIRYCDLGIKLRKPNGEVDRKSTVDFVVGPRLLIEQQGLPKHQKAAERYRAKLRLKVDAAQAAGWEMILIPPDRRPDDWLFERISESWAKSTIGDAENLMPKLKRADVWDLKQKNCLRLLAHIKDAEARLTGDKDPRKPTGLYEEKNDEHGNTVTVRRSKPILCLMESAAKQPDPAPSPDADVDDILDWITADE